MADVLPCAPIALCCTATGLHLFKSPASYLPNKEAEDPKLPKFKIAVLEAGGRQVLPFLEKVVCTV